MTMLLAGDLGGTKTKLALFRPDDGLMHPVHETTYPSAEFDSLATMVKQYLQKVGASVQGACFGVAGPVLDGRCQVTNLPWYLSEAQLREALALERVQLVNDLAAIACALPHLSPQDLFTINTGRVRTNETKAVIAPGTGLGEAFLTWDGQTYHAHPSEGGHSEFGPRNQAECELLMFLLERLGHVSYESLCSGVGLPNIYEFVKYRRSITAPALDTPSIINAALNPESPDPVCLQALEWFVSILGAEAGNLALKVMALGGVYLAGGLSIVLKQLIQSKAFIQAFLDKGRLKAALVDVPVHIILADNVGLCGAASLGYQYLQ